MKPSVPKTTLKMPEKKSIASLWAAYRDACLAGAPKTVTIMHEQAFYGGAFSALSVVFDALMLLPDQEALGAALEQLKNELEAFDQQVPEREQELARARAESRTQRVPQVPDKLLLAATDHLTRN